MERLLRKTKRHGHCSVTGHGHKCSIALEKQADRMLRGTEKCLVKKRIQEAINEQNI